MSLTNTTVPVLLCSFENSNVDSVSSISPSYSNNTAISYTTGKSGQSVFINGTVGAANNDGPYLTYPVSLNSYPGFTVCLWIYPTSLISGASNTQVFMSLTNGITTNGSYMQWGCDLGDPTKFHIYGQLPVAPNQTIYNGAYRTITAGTWTHLAISYSGTSFTAYINGSAYTTLGSSVLLNPVWITLGALNKGIYGVNVLSGSFGPTQYDDLRVYNRPLNSTQILAIYNAAGTPSAPIPQAFTSSLTLASAGTARFSNVTPGSVLAYSYLYSTVNMFGQSVGVDNGSNVYFGFQTAVLTSPMFPNSLQKVPDPYSLFFPTSGNNGGILLKYNKLGKLLGMMKTSPSNQSILAIRSDAGSNTYVTLSGIPGSPFNAYDIDGSTPNLNAQSVPAVTNILKYSPAGKLIGWGGGLMGSFNIVSSVALDSGSNVYICGYYRNSTTGPIYNIGTTNTQGGTLPSSVTPATAGVGSYWPTLFKWSPAGTFLGYSIIRGQNGNAACASAGSSPTLCPDNSGNIYWAGVIGSNIYCNVNSISTTEPTTNSYSLNTTQLSTTATINGSNAFVIQFGPSGTVIKFVEIGYGPTASGGRTNSATGIGVSSSGNVYISGNFSGSGNFLNFGLADPRTGSFLSASSVASVSTLIAGSAYLLCYNSSGVAQSVTQHMAATIQLTPAPFIIDKNDAMYQFLYYGNSTFTLYNLGQTSSGITVPLPGVGANYCIVKFNSAGNVVGFSPINNTNTNLPFNMAVDSTGVYLNCRFANASGGIANVNAISSSVSFFANLPTITGQGAAMIKWAL